MAPRYRPTIPLLVKYFAALRYAGLTPADVEFDHDPPLGLREYDEATRTYSPPANDPEKVVMRLKADHRAKTNGPRGPHTSIGGDIHAIAKTRGERAAKFQVDKQPLCLPSGPAPARCRICGHEPEICACAPRQQRSSFGRPRQ